MVFGIVSPAKWSTETELDNARKVLLEMGYECKIFPNNYYKYHSLAGTDEERAQAITNAFIDPCVDAILCNRGGYGSIRLLDKLDYKLINQNRKPFIGYSDVTNLLVALYKKAHVPVAHGIMFFELINENCNLSKEAFNAYINRDNSTIQGIVNKCDIRVIKHGHGRGPIIGGNLSTLNNLIGSDYFPDIDGHILFLEDIDEYYYSLDRMIQHFKMARVFEKLKGLIIGEMVDIHDDVLKPFGWNVDEIVLDACKYYSFPIISGFPCGHGEKKVVLQYGMISSIDTTSNQIFNLGS